MENIRRQLEQQLTGLVIERVRVHDPRLTAPATSAAFSRRLRGRRIEAVTRRGKYLRLRLDDGGLLVIHLRMTGVLRFEPERARPVPAAHLRMTVTFAGGGRLSFHDQRRFGTAMVLEPTEETAYFQRLGPEPLERGFNPARLQSIIDGRRRPIKSLLLDQRLIAGIGNIYADEALFRARIKPTRSAAGISAAEAERLSAAIKATLRDAIRLQGSSIDTYRDSGGRRGRFQETFRVHRRAGEPCPDCGGKVEKIRVGGRGTYFCPRCQR